MNSENRKRINEALQEILNRHEKDKDFVYGSDTDDIIELLKELLGLTDN